MAVISYKCPNCGGDLQFDPKTQNFRCEYCDSVFTEDQLGSKAEQPEATEQVIKQEGARIYSCPSCGAEIITDETTAATFCYYCHNPVVFQGQLSGDYEPDTVIPFTVDRKEAVDSFLAYVKKKRFVPKDFFCKEQIEKISGVYFPFWYYRCDADGEWHGTGKNIRVYRVGNTEYTETKVYDIDRNAELSFEHLTRNALNRENKQLVDAVQPFVLDQAKDFNYGYLSGFQAEKRDIEKESLQKDLQEEVKKHSSDMIRNSVKGYTSVSQKSDYIRVHDEDWKYLLVPVWVLTYNGKDGKKYYYAMNGQTKKVAGVLPLDKGKLVRLYFLLFAMFLLLLIAGGYFLW